MIPSPGDGWSRLSPRTLLLAPGFVTDVIGLLLVLPFTRPVARGLLQAVLTRHLVARIDLSSVPGVAGRASWEAQPPSGSRRSESSDEVVQGEIIDED